MSYLMFMFYLILLGALAIVLLAFIYKNDDLEKQIEEQQSLIDVNRRNLANAEIRISQKCEIIKHQEREIERLKEEK